MTIILNAMIILLVSLILSSFIKSITSNNSLEGFTSSRTPLASFLNYCLTGNPRAGSDYPTWPGYVFWKNLSGDMNDLTASGNYCTKSKRYNGMTASPYWPEYLTNSHPIDPCHQYSNPAQFYSDSSDFCLRNPDSQLCPNYWLKC